MEIISAGNDTRMLHASQFSILRNCCGVCALLALASISSRVAAEENSQEEEYARVIAARSHAIVAQLKIADVATAQRAEQMVVAQYRSLREIHDSRDAAIKSLQASSQKDNASTDKLIEGVRKESSIKQFQLHRAFLAKLSAELSCEQVIGIKDGMTYGVVPKTYARYLETIPNLTETEKRTIMAWLIEAREYAMDAGSSDEKHGWFRKYKGKINNYLSAAGHKT